MTQFNSTRRGLPFASPRSLTPSRRGFMAGATALGAAAGMGVWPGGALAAEPKKGGRLRVGSAEGSTTDTLDPQFYTDTFMLSLGFATHGTMTEIAPSGELVGDLAESWEASADAKSWTFKVRKGVEFHNGKTLTADDVIASINHHRGEDTKSAAKPIVDPIVDMTRDDDHTVTFVLTSGNADFPFLLADYHLLIMPAVDGKADWENYVGTGGYTLESFEPGVRATLKRHPNYWKSGRAHFDEVEMIVLADPSARQNALLTGDVDVISNIDPKTVHLLERAPTLKIIEATGFLHYTTPMITTSSPYDNNELRLAIKHGIDRDELLEKILVGRGTIGNDHPIAPSVPYWADLEQRTYDPEKARFHLKRSGYENVKLDLSAADAAFSGAVDASILMQSQLAKAGMDVNVIREPNDGYWSNVWMKKPWSACYWGGRPTCDWMFATAYEQGASWNDSFWSHERFNKVLLEARAELEPSLRSEMYREMQTIVRDEGGVVVWAFANYIMGTGVNVANEGQVAANWNLDGGRYIERWWLT